MPVFHLDHKLVDFDRWIVMFKGSELRKKNEEKYGVKVLRVLQDANDENHAIVVLEAEDKTSVKRLLGEPEVQERFADKTVFTTSPKLLGSYEGTWLEPAEEGENITFQLDQQLADFNKWFDLWTSKQLERTKLWEKHGCKPILILRDTDDDNHIIVVVKAPNKSALENLLSEPNAKKIFSNKEVFQNPPRIAGQFTSFPI